MQYRSNIMLSTSVYGFERDIVQICALLKELGYNVWNSHLGTIKVNPKLSNLENCLKAVEDCDLFLGITEMTKEVKEYLSWFRKNYSLQLYYMKV